MILLLLVVLAITAPAVRHASIHTCTRIHARAPRQFNIQTQRAAVTFIVVHSLALWPGYGGKGYPMKLISCAASAAARGPHNTYHSRITE